MTRLIPGRLVATMLALATVGLGKQLSVSVEIVPMSTVNVAFPILQDGGRSKIESRSLQFRTTGGEGGLHELLLFREPANGQVLSVARVLRNRFGTYAEAAELSKNALLSMDEGVMRAFFFTGFGLLVVESTTRAGSLDTAQRAALSDFVASAQQNPFRNWWASDEHWVRLDQQLPKSLASHFAELRVPPTHLRKLARLGRCWSMVLDGPSSESTRIAVDDNYDFTSFDGCKNAKHPVAHIILPPAETKLQVPALRNNQPTTLEIHSMLAQATFPNGEIGRLHLFMLYDPHSQLFWWTCRPLHRTEPDSVVENNNRNFLAGNSVFVDDYRIVVFSGTSAVESTEHYPDFQTAKAHVVSVLERIRGNIQVGGSWGSWGPTFHALNGIPGGFFYQCGHAEMAYPQLKRVERIGGLWRLAFTGANGNSAVLSLNDNYETANVQLSGSTLCGK